MNKRTVVAVWPHRAHSADQFKMRVHPSSYRTFAFQEGVLKYYTEIRPIYKQRRLESTLNKAVIEKECEINACRLANSMQWSYDRLRHGSDIRESTAQVATATKFPTTSSLSAQAVLTTTVSTKSSSTAHAVPATTLSACALHKAFSVVVDRSYKMPEHEDSRGRQCRTTYVGSEVSDLSSAPTLSSADKYERLPPTPAIKEKKHP